MGVFNWQINIFYSILFYMTRFRWKWFVVAFLFCLCFFNYYYYFPHDAYKALNFTIYDCLRFLYDASSSHMIKIFGGCIYFNEFVFLAGFEEWPERLIGLVSILCVGISGIYWWLIRYLDTVVVVYHWTIV